MAASSITHDFVIKDRESVELLADALSMAKATLPKPVSSVSGAEEVSRLMENWERGNKGTPYVVQNAENPR